MLGLNFLAMAISGIFTAVGGGIVRDVFVKEMLPGMLEKRNRKSIFENVVHCLQSVT